MKQKQPSIAVIIATRNRDQAIRVYSLASLTTSLFHEFICIVWDASDNTLTEGIIQSRQWPFPVYYFSAQRAGSSSQRNDAVDYVLQNHISIRYFVFIDDDTELSMDALGGVFESFQDPDVQAVNIPFAQEQAAAMLPSQLLHKIFKPQMVCKGRGVVEPYLYNYILFPEIPGATVDWIGGCGMAFRMELFKDMHIRFPESFQRFGGYAFAEDLAISFFIRKKLGKKIINSVCGSYIHHEAAGGRLNIRGISAARWYNMHLLFMELYKENTSKIARTAFIKFRGLLLYFLFRSVTPNNCVEVFKGVKDAAHALKKEQESVQGKLFFYNDCNDTKISD